MSASAPLVVRHGATSHVPYSHVAPRSERPTRSSRSMSTLDPSSYTVHTSSQPSPPRKKRSCRCFVCGGIGKHRLNPRFCPRTFELVGKHLAKFNADFRLVSFDGSPSRWSCGASARFPASSTSINSSLFASCPMSRPWL
ncbi:hypothetical protein B0H13DRAFT_2342338 [Mycena leptocephala]|nr:hypothetical protein B0H13DRAFT_2342338 [Mycena leptocephala]